MAFIVGITKVLESECGKVKHREGWQKVINGNMRLKKWLFGLVEYWLNPLLTIYREQNGKCRLWTDVCSIINGPNISEAWKFMKYQKLAVLLCTGLVQWASAQSANLITTLTNPAPVVNEWFGWSLASVSSNKVAIGINNYFVAGMNATGGAYLFNTNGTLLTTFTNPTPETMDFFGRSLASLGTDRLVIPAHGDNGGYGTVNIFDDSGKLLNTLTNPVPTISGYFGQSVAVLNNDRILIGAPGNNTVLSRFGVAYLLDMNGTLLNTFDNPTPANYDYFGTAVATLGDDRIVIGAPDDDTTDFNTGSAYLFDTNGTLLATFNNPSPSRDDRFGDPLAAMGTDRVIIGAAWADAGAHQGGEAYLFSTNGTLLSTFKNPFPSDYDRFAGAIAVASKDQVLIGGGAGLYLFNTNGTMLVRISNPSSDAHSVFGNALAVMDSSHIIIGAYRDRLVGDQAGAAYLFALPTLGPALSVQRGLSSGVTISWTPDTAGFVLQETESLLPGNWTNCPAELVNPSSVLTSQPAKYFRLVKP